jgi:DNA polymerase-3 subunit beta
MFELPVAELIKQIIDKTRFAISTEETRYYLNGIFLHVAEDTSGPVLKAAATDGHRLARVHGGTRPDGAASMPDVIVPRKCVAELRKLLDEADGSVVEISLSASKIRFELGAAILTSKLIDGTFPDYSRVIPTANDKLLKVDPKSLYGGRRPRLDDRERKDPRGQGRTRQATASRCRSPAPTTAPPPKRCAAAYDSPARWRSASTPAI